MTTFAIAVLAVAFPATTVQESPSYPVVDTGQRQCYDDARSIEFPGKGGPFPRPHPPCRIQTSTTLTPVSEKAGKATPLSWSPWFTHH